MSSQEFGASRTDHRALRVNAGTGRGPVAAPVDAGRDDWARASGGTGRPEATAEAQSTEIMRRRLKSVVSAGISLGLIGFSLLKSI
jgi:hypothetical protein